MLIDLINSGFPVHQYVSGKPQLVNVDHLRGYQIFDCNETASQIIESIERFERPDLNIPGKPVFTTWKFTENARTILGMGGDDINYLTFANLILPYQGTWLEYDIERFIRKNHPTHRYLASGIALSDVSDQITHEMRSDGARSLILWEFFNHYVEGTHTAIVNEDDAFVVVGDEGVFLRHFHTQQDLTYRQQTPLVISLLTLMMLNFQQLKSVKKCPPKPSRQQRRYAERNGMPLYIPIGYHVLTIETELFSRDDTSTCDAQLVPGEHRKKGGWENAWHTVRQHKRTMHKTGATTVVRSHHRGNPFKGIHWKDYKVS